jgi:ATP-dependent DNA ligase
MAAVDEERCSSARKPGATARGGTPKVQALLQLPGGPHLIDGEACVLRADGTSDFNLLQERARKRCGYPGAPPVTLTAFDILVHDGRLTMNLPLIERKALLEELLAGVPKVALLYVGHLDADANVFSAMVGAGAEIEGVMAKRRDSIYQPGVRSDSWRKIKRPGWRGPSLEGLSGP